MTPAKVTDLPAPTAPLPSSTTAEFIKSNWPAAKAKASEFVEFVEDPLESSGDIVLSVMYPKGQYTAGEEGGTHMSLDVFGEGKTRAMLTYQVSQLCNRSSACHEIMRLLWSYVEKRVLT